MSQTRQLKFLACYFRLVLFWSLKYALLVSAILLIGSPRSKYSVSEYFILRRTHNFKDLNNLQAGQNIQCLNILFCIERIIFQDSNNLRNIIR